MNTIEESTINLQHFLSKRAVSEDFGLQLKRFCQSFRFYSSLILVIVGKENFSDENGYTGSFFIMI